MSSDLRTRFVAAAVPERGTLGLLFIGFGAIGPAPRNRARQGQRDRKADQPASWFREPIRYSDDIVIAPHSALSD